METTSFEIEEASIDIDTVIVHRGYLRGILFHLSGRGAVHTRQAVPQ